MSEACHHHYVPVFYQRRFLNRNGLLWVYDRRLRTLKELPPRSICSKKDLYTLKRENAPSERRIETVALSLVDTFGAKAVREVLNGRFTETTISNLSYFIGVQFSRLPSMARAIGAMYVAGANEMWRLMAANVGRMQSVLDRYTRDTGEAVNVSAESMVEAVRGGHVELVPTQVPFLRHLFSLGDDICEVIRQLDWQVLSAPLGTGFIICDSPVTVVPPRGGNLVGFGVWGAVKYFPLSYGICLRFGNRGHSIKRRTVSKETVTTINRNIAANSERFIMGPDKAQLVSIVKRSNSEHEDKTARFNVDTIDQDDSGSTQKMTFQYRRYFYCEDGRTP